MASKHYSIDQLQTLLQDISEEVQNSLFDFTNLNNQYFYENFTNISLKAIKYINHFLNLINTNQVFGIIIDDLLKTLTQSLKQYKSRNVFAQSNYSFETDNNRDDDQIYHFMNTRNTLLPLQCLNNYQNQKQRLELQQFVQQMQKQTKYHQKQSKRSLILPKQNYNKLKIGRKATYDVQLKPIKQQTIQNSNFAIVINQATKNCDHVEIQTYQEELVQLMPKKSQADIASQCDNISIYENGLSTVSINNHNKNKTNIKKNTAKSKKKNLDQNESKFKKAKFSPSKPIYVKQQNSSSQKQSIQRQKLTLDFDKQKQKTLQSMISVKISSPILTLCNKQIDIFIINQMRNVNGNVTTNNSTPAISRKKLMTKTCVQILKSSRKVNTEVLPVDGEAGLENNNLKKDISIQSPSPQITKQMNSQLQNTVNAPRKLRYFNSKSPQEKQIVQEGAVVKSEDAEGNAKNANSENIQKIPISSVKINENNQLQNHQQIHIKNQQQNPTNSPHFVNKGKRNTFTVSKQAFKSFNTSIQNEGADMSKHLRTSKMHLQAYGEKPKLKKESYRSNNKSSSFATVNGGESYQSLQSQEYLISRQKTCDQVELINRLAQIQRNRQSNRHQIRIEDGNIKTTSSHMKSKKNSQQNFREKNQRNSRQFEGQSGVNNLMVVFSNKNRVVQDKISKFKPECTKSMQTSQIQNSTNSQNTKDIQQQKQLQQNRHQSLSSKQGQLTTIIQANRHEQSTIEQSKLTMLHNARSSQCRTVDINATRSNKTLYRQSSQIVPLKTSILKVQNALFKQNKKIAHSASQHSINLQNYQINQFRRKLRNRVYKDKLDQYLGLVESTHKRFCGDDCEHITELYKGKEGDISQHIFRLFKKLK